MIVEGGLPDDFGFGFMPRSTCAVLSAGGLMEDGDSCRAVVRYSPSEYFVGSQQTGSLTVTATDPDSGALVESMAIPVTATGKL